MFNGLKEQLVVYLWLIFHFKPFLVTEKLLNEQFQVDFNIGLQFPACFPAVISYNELLAIKKICVNMLENKCFLTAKEQIKKS